MHPPSATETKPQAMPDAPPAAAEVREFGAPIGGEPQSTERRLFIQLQVFGGCKDPQAAAAALRGRRAEGAVYLDVNDPQGIGVLLMSEQPDWFVRQGRELLNDTPFSSWQRKAELTMFGRTYAMGREADVQDWLLGKPRRAILNPEWPWAVWYPLRRKPEFALLARDEQGKVLAEHAKIGMAFGQAGHAADIRLACHGIDRNDNEFIIGLTGPALAPLSILVQEMRKSQQTARYIQSMGPFFVGRTLWQSPCPK